MILLAALLAGLFTGILARHRINTFTFLTILVIISGGIWFAPPSYLARLMLHHQENSVTRYLHATFKSFDEVRQAIPHLLKQREEDPSSFLTKVCKKTGFKGWYTLLDEGGNPVAWNHHLLPLPPAASSPTLRWNVDGWHLTTSFPVPIGRLILSSPNTGRKATLGMKEITFLPIRLFAPLPRGRDTLKATLLWKEKDLPPFLQVHVETEPLPLIRRTFRHWGITLVLLFGLGFLTCTLRRWRPYHPLLFRALLLFVPWSELLGINTLTNPSLSGLDLLHPLFANPFESLLTLVSLGCFILTLKKSAAPLSPWIKRTLFLLSLLLLHLINLSMASRMGLNHLALALWIIPMVFLLGTLLYVLDPISASPVRGEGTWSALLIVLLFSACLPRGTWLILLLLLLATLLLMFRKTFMPARLFYLFIIIHIPFTLFWQGSWKQEIAHHYAQETANQSLAQLDYLSGPVRDFFSECDLTHLFPHAAYIEDWRPLARRLAQESGLLRNAVPVSLTVFAGEEPISTYANFPIPSPHERPDSKWQVVEREVFGDTRPIYVATFPLQMEGQPWGSVAVDVMINDPHLPLFVQPWEGRHRAVVPYALYDRRGEMLRPDPSTAFPHILPQSVIEGEDRSITSSSGRWLFRFREGNTFYLFALPSLVETIPFAPAGLIFLVGVIIWIFRHPFPRRSLSRRIVLLTLGGIGLFTLSLILMSTWGINTVHRQFNNVVSVQKAGQLGRLVTQFQRERILTDPKVGYLLSRLAGRHLFIYDGGHLIYSTLPGVTDSRPDLSDLPPAVTRTIRHQGWLEWNRMGSRLVFIPLPASGRIVAFSGYGSENIGFPPWANLVGCLIALLLGGLILLIIALTRRVVYPLYALTQSARDVMEGKPFSPPGIRSPQEVETLASALTTMVETLQREKATFIAMVEALPLAVALMEEGEGIVTNRAFDRVQALFPEGIPEGERWNSDAREWKIQRVALGNDRELVILEDITEMVKKERYEAWFRMARITAHEIKNPLTPLTLTLDYMQEMFKEKPADFKKEFPHLVAEMVEQMEELNRTALEFSDFARITESNKERFDLTETLADWLQPYLHQENFTLIAPDESIIVSGDRRLIKRAILNVLNNALQASTPPPDVTLTVAPASGEVILRVEDAGPGVDLSHFDRLFEPYFSTKSGGTGLGLAIAHRIVTDHGGKIEAHHRDPGGLTITITLPIPS